MKVVEARPESARGPPSSDRGYDERPPSARDAQGERRVDGRLRGLVGLARSGGRERPLDGLAGQRREAQRGELALDAVHIGARDLERRERTTETFAGETPPLRRRSREARGR